jgi:hypothetical protein
MKRNRCQRFFKTQVTSNAQESGTDSSIPQNLHFSEENRCVTLLNPSLPDFLELYKFEQCPQPEDNVRESLCMLL